MNDRPLSRLSLVPRTLARLTYRALRGKPQNAFTRLPSMRINVPTLPLPGLVMAMVNVPRWVNCPACLRRTRVHTIPAQSGNGYRVPPREFCSYCGWYITPPESETA